MAIQSSFGFKVSSFDPIDTRILLTKAEMLAADPDDYPDVYFAFCIDDGQWYRFDYEIDTPDPETGHFRKLELGGTTPTAGVGPVADRPAAGDSNPGDKWYDPETGKTYIVVKDSEGNKSWVETTPTPGEMMYDSVNNQILYFDGTEWKEVGSLGNTASGTTAPSPAKKGDLWLDTNQNPPVLKVYDGAQWKNAPVKEGEMMYDDTNNQILYYDGTQWKPIGGGVEKVETLPAAAEEGKIYFDSEGQYKVYEDGVWFTLAKTWEGTEAQYTALGGDTYSQAHPDVVFYITD